ncbi:MAG: 50S ribosomal protein L11 methyltransferase [Saprospiraceae bacterium]|nr:50S ribosomal protein L11 methyltransferase [Saprospiraceae bacterium]
MDSYQYRFLVDQPQQDILLAFLSTLPFDAFEEKEGEILAFCPANHATPELEAHLGNLLAQVAFKYERELIPYQNWNAVWEENFTPIIVDKFCGIRADFHPSISNVKHEIRINPKMAFGTGHHATTRMMIQMMKDLPLRNSKVLDFGSGTGILAILAAKMGALLIDAVDIEKPAYENAIENCQLNDVDVVQVYLGGLQVVLDSGYDVILANINRNVILDSLNTLYKKLKRSGILLISGILQEDEELVLNSAKTVGFTIDEKKRMDKWSCISLIS